MDEHANSTHKNNTGNPRSYIEGFVHTWTLFVGKQADEFAAIEYIDRIHMKRRLLPEQILPGDTMPLGSPSGVGRTRRGDR